MYDVYHEINGTQAKPKDFMTQSEADELIADLTRRGKL